MSTPHNLPDYRERYFETKALDRIHGKPSLPQIIKCFRQLKRNAQRVPTRLGGGKHGYLALLLPDAKYNALPGTIPFIRPLDPGVFRPSNITSTAPTGATTRARSASAGSTSRPPNSAELAEQKARYEERLRLFLEVQTVETLLRNQLLAAFDDDYTQALRDANDMINISIPKILTYLVNLYGQMKPEELRSLKSEVEEYTYDPILPIDVLFNKIDFYSDLAEFAKKPLPDGDKVDIAYIILNRLGVFQTSLKEWNSRLDNMKTFDHFKSYFRAEHLALDKVNALEKQDSSLNQVEILEQQEQMFEKMEERLKINLINTITNFAQAYDDSPPTPPPPEPKEQDNTSLTSALSTITNNSSKQNAKLIKLFDGLCKKVDSLETKLGKNNNSSSEKENNVNPRTGRPWKRYCWTCGCCDHWGRTCPVRKPGHKVDATFKNRMGGSTKGVLGA